MDLNTNTRISVMAAYRRHVKSINSVLNGTGVGCTTLHKMCGAENDVLILATTRSNLSRDLGFMNAEVAIISMVISNTKQDYHEAIGFLNNSRACVAFSRGKRKTIRVGDQTTLIKNKFLARSIDTITRKDGFFIWRNSN
jgi:superfamily I DNA and/or RNA helicase